VCPIWNMLVKHSCAQDPRGDDGSVVEPLSGTLGDLRTGVWAVVCRLKALPEPSATELDLWVPTACRLGLLFVLSKKKYKKQKTHSCVYVCVGFGFIRKLSC
jgi:hypothetical protein